MSGSYRGNVQDCISIHLASTFTYGVWGLRFWALGLGFRVWVYGLRFGVLMYGGTTPNN